MYLVEIALVLVLHPGVLSLAGDTIGVSRFIAALFWLFAAGIAEETGKACGIALSRPAASRFSWFWLTAATAGVFGLLERWGLTVNRVPDGISPLAGLLFDIRGVVGHIALSMVCVATARMAGGRLKGWAIGIFVAGLLHGLSNFVPRRLPMEIRNDYPFAAPIVSGVIFLAIILAAYVYRRRLDWRIPAAV
jgi:RsiW-degrading membrane proteinase PrsW (M82 family)